MRTFSAVLSLTALLAAASALHAETATERGERQLARMLGDRVAGPPVDCFEYVSATKKIEIDGVALVYDTGDVVYVARPANAMDPRDTIMGGFRGRDICASQKFFTVSRQGGMRTGIADITEFVPYRRPS